MTPGFVIAILLCTGDNCEVARAEPGTHYPTYDACSSAIARKIGDLDDIAAQYRSPGRPAEIVCLRELLRVTEIEEEHEAIDAAVVREAPSATSRRIVTLTKGKPVLVTGMIADQPWLRVQTADGQAGFVYRERLRQIARVPADAAPPQPAPRTGSGAPGSGAIAPTASAGGGVAAAALRPPPAPAPPQPQPRVGEFRDCEQCPLMVPLPGGSFMMGSDNDATERPIHRASVPAFAIGRFEVTEAEWGACVAAGACAFRPPRVSDTPEQTPMTNLSWDDAIQFVQWLRRVTGKPYRLPSETEWEYAARAGTDSRYSWGAQVGVAKANCDGCGGPHDSRRPAPVTAFGANSWGLYGLHGGVAEWTEDCWHSSYQGVPVDGAARRAGTCSRRVVRGGSWRSNPNDVTVSSRNFYDASVRYIAHGLRVALSLR